METPFSHKTAEELQALSKMQLLVLCMTSRMRLLDLLRVPNWQPTPEYTELATQADLYSAEVKRRERATERFNRFLSAMI